MRTLDAYARDPEKALAVSDLYNLRLVDRYVRDIEAGRVSGFSTEDLSLATLLHFEAAQRTPAEQGAALVRLHLRGGMLLARRLHARGERAFLGRLFVAAFHPLVNELPLDVLRHLTAAQKLLPSDPHLVLMSGATLESLAMAVRDPNPPKPLAATHPCSPSIAHCLTDAERLLRRAREHQIVSAEAHLRWARVRHLLGRDDGAVALRDIKAKGVEPYATLATLFLARGAADATRMGEAADLYRSVPSPGAAAYVAALGRAALSERDDDVPAALAALLPALAEPPDARHEDLWLRYRTFALEPHASLRHLYEEQVRR